MTQPPQDPTPNSSPVVNDVAETARQKTSQTKYILTTICTLFAYFVVAWGFLYALVPLSRGEYWIFMALPLSFLLTTAIGLALGCRYRGIRLGTIIGSCAALLLLIKFFQACPFF